MTEETARCWDKIRLPGEIPLLLQRIPKSSAEGFQMGSRGNGSAEEPVHRVLIPSDFYLGTFVVTQQQFGAVAREVRALQGRIDPSEFKGENRPVENVDWREANQFCAWLSKHVPAKQLPSGFTRFCLPTEAEWEYACRAGTETDYYSGDGEAALAEVGWFESNSGDETHPVDEKPEAHRWGLRGMHGNVWEWCHDIYDPDAYRALLDGDTDPGLRPRWDDWTLGVAQITRDADDRYRVIRGGSLFNSAWWCRSASRFGRWPVDRYWLRGFRVCLVRGPVSPGGARQQKGQAEARRVPGVGVRQQRTETDGASRAGAVPIQPAAKHSPGFAGRNFLSKSTGGKTPPDSKNPFT